MKKYAIIVAGGKGLRMGGELPKQFIPIEGRPVLMRTLDTFHACDPDIKIILVLPRDHQPYWQELCREYAFIVPHRIADGGTTRFHSVQNGLALVDDAEALVAVHDGVRPFVSHEVISRCYQEAASYGAVVPVIPIVETVRQLVPLSLFDEAACQKEIVNCQLPIRGASPCLAMRTVWCRLLRLSVLRFCAAPMSSPIAMLLPMMLPLLRLWGMKYILSRATVRI